MSGVTVGQFDFDDGGSYCGVSEGGKAHGIGICTGPGGQGEYAGAWQFGFELSGVYTWPNGNDYAGQWMQGKRHGLGVERRGHWEYRGEWTQGTMGRYGVRQSTTSDAKYEGTWTSGLQDGYGLETYSDGGTYQGQWMKGCRHGYGVRHSAVFSKAAKCRQLNARRSSITSVRSTVDTVDPSLFIDQHKPGVNSTTARIGFFLKGKPEEKSMDRRNSVSAKQPNGEKMGDSLKRQRSADDLVSEEIQHRVGPVGTNLGIIGNSGYVSDAVEVYTGEWKMDKRSGFGVSERTDGLRYEGEWSNNCKNGYGVTTFPDGSKEEGKYKNNILQSPSRRTLLLRASKYTERIHAAIASAQRSAQIATQKSDIANSRMESARSKAELADQATLKGRQDAETAKRGAKEINRMEQQQTPISGPPNLSKRFSIPRQHMVDTQLENSAQTNSLRSPEVHQNEIQRRQSLLETQNQTHQQSNVRRRESPLRNRTSSLAPVAEADSRQGSFEHLPKKILEKHSTNYSQTNHVSVPRMGSRPESQISEEFNEMTNSLNNVNRPSTRSTGTQMSQQMSQRDRVGDASLEPDQLPNDSGELSAEIENIFSYLAEEEEEFGRVSDASRSPEVSSVGSTLTSKQSLRQRRDVRCPDLVIFQRDVKAEEKPPTNGVRKRRLTLPSIVRYLGPSGPVAGRGTGKFIGSVMNLNNNDVENQQHGRQQNSVQTIVIEDGIRKRLEEELDWRPPPLPPDIDPVEEMIEPPKELRRKFRLENVKMARRQELGSMPDIALFPRLQAKAIPWHEAELLSKHKREEIKLIQEEQTKHRRRAIVLKLGDFKDWIRRNFFVLLVISFNIALIDMFYKLLVQ